MNVPRDRGPRDRGTHEHLSIDSLIEEWIP